MGSVQKAVVSETFKRKALSAFPPFEKGGKGRFALDLPVRKQKQILLDPFFSKGEETP